MNTRGCITDDNNNTYQPCVVSGCNKLDVYDWLNNLPQTINPIDIVEVRFKNTRKGFYKNINKINLKKGDIVAVEASPGHDIGIVSLTGELVVEQMRKYNLSINPDSHGNSALATSRANSRNEQKKIYRKAKPVDIEKWQLAIDLETVIMLKARKIATELGLNMKIGDVEFQGDKTKAIFYYIADERVDFRELIKILADEFKIRVEMRQIGARQEAGRIGGIGTCGRELCCTTWVTNFVSVTTNAARSQELSLNPLKLAGQCGKLKCCLNYELSCYLDARKNFPDINIPLETEEGKAFHQKTDIFKKIMWYSFKKEEIVNMVAIPAERVAEIIRLNAKGKIVKKLNEYEEESLAPDYENVVGQERLDRFDEKNTKPRKKKRRKPRRKSNGGDKKNVK